MTGSLRSGEVARSALVNVQTLRYYERRGLLQRPDRSPGGHRLYPPDTVTLLRVIRSAQRLGFTLDEVAELIQAGHHRHRARSGSVLQALATEKLAEVEDRLADLAVIRDTLRATLEVGCDDLRTCAASECCPVPFAELAAPVEPASDAS